MAPASSKSIDQCWHNWAARSLALGVRSALRDSGRTATLIGASRLSSLSTTLLSTPPLVFGASSSEYACSNNVGSGRDTPAAGAMADGMYRTPVVGAM